MTQADAPAVLELWDRNAHEAAGKRLDADNRGRIAALLAVYPGHPDAAALVATTRGMVAGYAVGIVTRHPIMDGLLGEIEALYVTPEHRRAGLGSALVARLTARLRERGAETVQAKVCSDSGLARAFWRAEAWEDDLVLFTSYAAGAVTE